MKRLPFDQILRASQYLILAGFAVLLLLKVFSSLEWRMEHDPPMLHYFAFLMDRYGLVPYRDIFETSMPVTFAFHYLVGKLFGYSDAAFRFADLALLTGLLFTTGRFMLRFGQLPALWAVTLFGLFYLSMGQLMTLQRDYIGVTLVAFALLSIPDHFIVTVRLWRFALAGMLFGLAFLIKPQLGIGLPVIVATLLAFRWQVQRPSLRDFVQCAAVSTGALLLPLLIALAWLAAHSALLPFVDLVVNYLPLYNHLTENHEIISATPRLLYLVSKTAALGGWGALLGCALFGCYRVAADKSSDQVALLSMGCLAFCTLAYAIYPVIGAKFWDYHYMPMVYFGAVSCGLCLFSRGQPDQQRTAGRAREILATLILLITITIQLPLYGFVKTLTSDLRTGPEAHAPKYGRVDEMAGWLKDNIQSGDTVQPLDWTGGTLHAMLLAQARLSNKFPYDYFFYHDVSTPYIQAIKQSFVEQLRQTPPRFMIEVITNKPWVSGIDTTREFPEIRALLDHQYRLVFEGDGYRIYEQSR